MSRNLLSLLALLVPVAGCDGAGGLLDLTITGEVEVAGDAPSGYSLKLYPYSDNTGAFDTSYCDEVTADCLGRVKVGQLNSPAEDAEIEWNGKKFTITTGVDAAFVLVATGDDDTIVCTTDIIGFDEETKVVTQDSIISFDLDGDITELELPRKVSLNCSAPATEPEAPTEEPSEGEVPDTDIPEGDGSSWTSFTVTGKNGSPEYADASAGSTAATGLSCDSSFPAVLEVHAEAANATDKAYLRIQFGSGDEASFRTFEVPIVDGMVSQAFSLTGGYSVVQLDFDDVLDNGNESYNVTFCDRDTPPAQQLLTILTWDKDDTDVDTHIYNSNGTEVAYYSMTQDWGSLDIDDVNGFGPETFTSTGAAFDDTFYQVKVHYYSDHGNGATNATMRVVYYDDASGELCDITSTASMNSYDWWDVGAFGPGICGQ